MNSIFFRKINLPFIFFNLLCWFFLILFLKLGIWQIHRLAWKTNLIATVNSRIHQLPVEAPRKNQWDKLLNDNIAYLPVKLSGHFLINKDIYVTTVNNGQTGYWQMKVLQRDDNSFVFINRGFVPMDLRSSAELRESSYIESQNLKGILRLNEKSHGFLYKNNIFTNKWYKRNIKEMAIKLNIPINNVAPYFIDEIRQLQSKQKYPLGGLTIISFPNSHLSYAITWFILAFGVLCAMIFIISQECYKYKKL